MIWEVLFKKNLKINKHNKKKLAQKETFEINLISAIILQMEKLRYKLIEELYKVTQTGVKEPGLR